MRKSTTDRMDDYDAVVIGVLEPILVLSVMAVIAFLLSSSRFGCSKGDNLSYLPGAGQSCVAKETPCTSSTCL